MFGFKNPNRWENTVMNSNVSFLSSILLITLFSLSGGFVKCIGTVEMSFDFLPVSTSCLMGHRLLSYVKNFPEQVSIPGCIS